MTEPWKPMASVEYSSKPFYGYTVRHRAGYPVASFTDERTAIWFCNVFNKEANRVNTDNVRRFGGPDWNTRKEAET